MNFLQEGIMRKGLSIFLIIVAVLVLVLLAGVLAFNKQYNELLKEVDTEFAIMEKIDMSKIENGEYNYRFGKIPVFIDLTVVVKDHKIESVIIQEQSSGPGYDALETIDRILSKQQAKVDVVSGASTSSKVIMIATHKALIEH